MEAVHPRTSSRELPVIAERLRADGIEIARRTVARYCMQLDILPSSLR